jgi:hypothetical protein
MGREWLFDQLHPEAFEVRQQGERIVRYPARVGVDADRAAVDGPDGLERLQIGWPAELDLEGGEMSRPRRALGDDLRSV